LGKVPKFGMKNWEKQWKAITTYSFGKFFALKELSTGGLLSEKFFFRKQF
jgi:hypothetical protein